MSTWVVAERRSARSTTAYAILGLLSVGNWTTYELAKQVQRSLNWMWPRAERKLYDEPKNLVAEGLATAARHFTGQRPRTVYEITDAGREALRRWLDEPSVPRTSDFEAMLKVFFADGGSLQQLAARLDEVETTTAERLRALTAMAETALAGTTAFPERRHISALSIRSQFVQEVALLEWARWARAQIRAWRSTTDAGNWDYRSALAEAAADAHRALGDASAPAPA
jgi:DNA-binding PadR family transcriptional regulator